MGEYQENPSVGDAISDKLAADKVRGTITIAGHEVEVGRDLAYVLDPLVQEVQTWISKEGAASARKYGMQLGNWIAPKHAGKIGNSAEMLWRFGLPVVDVVGGIKNAVKEGYAQMHQLSQDASAVVSANSGVQTSIAGAMALNFSAIKYERKLVLSEARKQVGASLTSFIKNTPGVIINMLYYKKHRLESPELAASATVEALDAPAVKSNSLMSTVSRMILPDTVEGINQNLKYEKWAPTAGAIGARLVSNHIEKDVGTKTSAWRNIKTLENVIKQQEPSSGGDVESYVRDVFQQHVYDSGQKTQLAGARYNHIIKEVSAALVHGGMHPEALVELLDDKKVIALQGSEVTYGKPLAVKEALARLTEKYAVKVSTKEFYKDVPFTKEKAAQLFNALSEEEKPLYVMLFPPGALEGAGIKKEEVEKYRKIGSQSLTEELTNAIGNMLQVGDETLRKQGVKEEQIAELQVVAKEFQDAANYNHAPEYIRENLEDMKALVRNTSLTAKDPKKLWTEVIAPRETADISPQAMTGKGPMDHALRESSDAREIG
jgi:hypothetical protein